MTDTEKLAWALRVIDEVKKTLETVQGLRERPTPRPDLDAQAIEALLRATLGDIESFELRCAWQSPSS